MKLKRTFKLVFNISFILAIGGGCTDNLMTQEVGNGFTDARTEAMKVIKSLEKKGNDSRFETTESISESESDLESIAYRLSMLLGEVAEGRKILNQVLQSRDAYGEVSFLDFLLSEYPNGQPVFDDLRNHGLENLADLIIKHPDLRLSIPLQFDESFNAEDDFIIAASPLRDERFVDYYVTYALGGDRILIDHDKEYTGPTPVLLLEIDEDPDNHPMKNSSSNNPSQSSLGKTLSFELWTDQQYLYNKLEGTFGRAEFNYTAARGSYEPFNCTFGEVVSVNGITGVNWARTWYYFDHDVIEDPFSEGSVCALTVWEDDPGGESPWEYYPADPYWESEANFEHGYLDDPSHDSPDDLYGYIFIHGGDGVPTTYGAAGYRSSAGGNHAYPDNPLLNAKMRINLP